MDHLSPLQKQDEFLFSTANRKARPEDMKNFTGTKESYFSAKKEDAACLRRPYEKG